jgi:DNA sulfur modification protein DndD
MRFLQLSLQNFGPYRQRQTLNLETTAERPLILLGGMNGGGKTTLMDALRLALYGQRARCSARGSLAYGDFLRQSRHRHSAPEELTEIELILEDIVDGQPRQYSIRRVWDSAVKTNRDRLEVTVGAWQDEALTQTWDEYIEKLFPLGISNLFLFDGEQVKELAEREEPTPEILQAMRGLLGLELPNTLYQDLTVLINRKSKDGAAPEERRSLEELENWVQEAQAEQGEAAAAQASLQGKLDRALAELREAREAFYREGGKISAQQTQLQQTLEELRDAEKRQTEEQLKLAAQDLPLAQIRPLLDQALIHGKQEQEYELRALTYDQLLAQSRRFERLLEQLALTESQARQAQTFLAQEQTEPALLETWLEAEPETLHLLESLLRHSLPDQGRRSQQLQGELDQTRRRQTEVERRGAGSLREIAPSTGGSREES